jgi:carboxyl-terminal processing protease
LTINLENRPRLIGQFGAALLLALLAGCGLVDGNVTTVATDEPHAMFLTGFEKVEEIYIREEDLGELALTGLTKVAGLDPRLAVTRQADQIVLTVDGKQAAQFHAPAKDDADGWGNLTADIVAAARAASPALKAKPKEDIYEAFFTGLVSKLDTFSRYSTAKQAVENRAQREGFGGIGIRVAVEEKAVRVMNVMRGTPAERVGILADDIITEVDGKPVAGLEQDQVIDILRGPIDSHVKVTIVRKGGAAFVVNITRALIVPETAAYERKGDVAYVHLTGFNVDTAQSLSTEMLRARRDIGPGIKGYILDLRDNPGGLLDQSEAVADLFMNDGRIVFTRGRHPDSNQYSDATPGDVADGKPMVVLVNGDSASASEIVAAALQDSGRAVVVGSNSFGKGTVQQVVTMPNEGELTLTWARFHAPSGYTLHRIGVIPSICTNTKGETAKQLIGDLRQGRIKPVPTDLRNIEDPDNSPLLGRLRAICPVRSGEDPVDVEVALDLLARPGLYRRAVHLADVRTGPSPASAAAVSQVQP